MPVNRCPSCRTALLAGATECRDCGWKERSDKSNTQVAPHRCAYSSGSVRCPAPGTMTNDFLGRDHRGADVRRWYCRPHLNCDSPKDGAQIIEHYRRHGVPKTRDWRNVLIAAHMAENMDEVYRLTNRAQATNQTKPTEEKTHGETEEITPPF